VVSGPAAYSLPLFYIGASKPVVGGHRVVLANPRAESIPNEFIFPRQNAPCAKPNVVQKQDALGERPPILPHPPQSLPPSSVLGSQNPWKKKYFPNLGMIPGPCFLTSIVISFHGPLWRPWLAAYAWLGKFPSGLGTSYWGAFLLREFPWLGPTDSIFSGAGNALLVPAGFWILWAGRTGTE